ncbi:MAG: LacI family DNA-binding transcriptional regulator [Candidatus Thermochlorobacter sp.]
MKSSRKSQKNGTATLKDVAKLAGLTPAAVSMILNGRGKFKESTVAKVRRIAEQVNYVPNASAYRLVKQRTNLIGLLVPSMVEPFTIEILRGVEEALKGTPYNLVIYSTAGNDEQAEETIYRNIARGKQVDGLVVQLFDHTERRTKVYASYQLPCAVIEADLKSLDSVSVDNVKGACEATDYLIRQGRQRIVFPYASASTVMSERLEGHLTALRQHGLPIQDELLIKVLYETEEKFNFNEGVKLIERLLQKVRQGEMKMFDAVFCANGDEVAAGVVRTLIQHHIKVPHDVAVIGFDDQPIARIVTPALTTVRQPVRQMGRTAVEFLLRRLENPKQSPQSMRIVPELIIRETA